MIKNKNDTEPHDAPEDYSDRRKHFRVNLPLKARFLNEAGEEYACLVSNISAGGAMLRTKHPPGFGKAIVLYVDDLGRFEGKVIRAGANSFVISYEKRRNKSAKTADGLTKIMNQGRRSFDRRKMPRIQHDAPAIVYFEDGRAGQCAILDISLTGASIEISPRPPLGAKLILGRMTAKVVRRHEKGVGVVFTGAAQRMEEVIADASVGDARADAGAPFADDFGKNDFGKSAFGKKGASA